MGRRGPGNTTWENDHEGLDAESYRNDLEWAHLYIEMGCKTHTRLVIAAMAREGPHACSDEPTADCRRIQERAHCTQYGWCFGAEHGKGIWWRDDVALQLHPPTSLRDL